MKWHGHLAHDAVRRIQRCVSERLNRAGLHAAILQMDDVNDDFREFAAAFTGELDTDYELAFPDKLARKNLDYSLESLKYVDDYLEYLHEHRPAHLGMEWTHSILWAGAYVGEVIRQNAIREYEWLHFDDWIRLHPDLVEYLGSDRVTEVIAILRTAEGSFAFPLSKVYKFIANGREDSVRFFAECECRSR